MKTKLLAVVAGLAAQTVRPVTVDILVAYDNGGRDYVAAKGETLASFAERQIEKMNAVLATNRLDTSYTYRLAGVCRVEDTFTNINFAPSRAAAGEGACVAIRAAREMYGADTVTFLVKTGGGYLGHGSPLSSGTDVASCHEDAYDACSIAAVDTGDQHTMIHENAHHLGCGHSRSQASNPGPAAAFPYASGYYFKDAVGTSRHTIMAYDTDGKTWHAPSWYFSTSSDEFGLKLGDADNDNARVLRETCGAVSQWREAVRPYAGEVVATDVATGESLLTGRIFANSITIALTCPEGVDADEIRYTLDGSAPSKDSMLYTGPITLDTTAVVSAAPVAGGRLASARVVKLFRLDALPDGAKWSTNVSYPWFVDADGFVRTRNHTDYKTAYGRATMPLKAVVEGPARLVFDHKTFFMPQSRDSNYSHFDVLLDDAPVLALNEFNTNSWTRAGVEVPRGEHEIQLVYSQRSAMNNPLDNKDGVAGLPDDAVWLRNIKIETAPPDGSFEVAKGETVKLADIPSGVKSVVGEGTVDCGAALPGDLGWMSSAWGGTLAFSGLKDAEATKDFQFECYGGAGSRILLRDCEISYLKNNNATFAGSLVLEGERAFTTKDGYSSNYNCFGALAGGGSMSFDTKQKQGYVFGSALEFTGGIHVGAALSGTGKMEGRRIVFGSVKSPGDLPEHSATIVVQSGAAAAIGAGAGWYAYNGIEIAGVLAVKGPGATLGCDGKNATLMLRLDDGATLRFDAPDAVLAFASGPVFPQGKVKVAFGEGVSPVDGAILVDWSAGAQPLGEFVFADTGLAGRWALAKTSKGLSVSRIKPANRLDIGENGAYIAWDESLQEWMDAQTAAGGQQPDPSLTWQQFLGGKAMNGYSRWACYLLGLDKTWLADDTIKSRICFEDGRVVIRAAENVRELEGAVIYTTLYGGERLVRDLPKLKTVRGVSVEQPAGKAGFYRVELDVRAE